jgi:hypothetical protein
MPSVVISEKLVKLESTSALRFSTLRSR